MPITVADLNVRVRANTSEAKGALSGVQGAAQRSASGAAGAFTRMGPQIGQAFTAVGSAAGYAFTGAVESAALLADEMTNVRTVVPDADIAKLTDEVQALSRASGVGTSDLTAGLYDLVSAGVSADDAIGVLAASTNLAIVGLGTTAGAADVVTSALNAYGMSADQAGSVTDIFALAIQKGKVTADEIGASIANIAPVAASAGVSLEEVGAGYAALTAKGVPAAQAATQMRAAISALLTPNETLNALQEQTGKNFADIAAEKGLAVALEELRVATEGNATALDSLAGVSAEDFPDALATMQDELGLTNSEIEKFSAIAGRDGAGAALSELAKEVGVGDSAFGRALGSIEGYQFALNTTGDSAATFQSTIGDMFDATGTAAEQAAIKMESPVEQGKRLFATFSTFLQDVGAPFASTLGPVLFGLNQLSPAMKGLISPARIAGGAIGGLATKVLPGLFNGLKLAGRNFPTALGYFDLFASKLKALGPKITGALSSAFSGLGSKLGPKIAGPLSRAFAGVVPMLGGAISGVVTGIGGLFAAAMPLLVAALPFLIAAAIIAGIVLLIVNPEIRNAVFGFVGGIIGWIGDALGGLGDFLGGIFGGAFDAVAGVIGKYLEIITWPIRTFIGFLGTIFGGIADAAETAWDVVSTIVGVAIAVITAPIRLFIDFLSTIFGGIAGPASDAWDVVTGIVGTAIDVITAPIRVLVEFLSTIFGGMAGPASTAWDAVSGIVGTAIEVITAPIRALIELALSIFAGVAAAAGVAWEVVKSVVGGAVSFVTGLIQGLTGVVSTVWSGITGFFDWLTGKTNTAKTNLTAISKAAATPTGQFVPANAGGTRPTTTTAVLDPRISRYQSGAWETANELAYLHAGEMVLPPDLADSFRRFLGHGGASSPPVSLPPMAAAGGRGDTIVEHMEVVVPIQGLLRAETPADVADQLRRSAALGYLTPRPVGG